MALGTLNTYLVDAEQMFDEAAKAERWYLTFAIPDADWPDDWSIVPARGAVPPVAPNTFPSNLNIDGTCLRRKVSFNERPGFTILRLTYGYDIAILANNTAVVTGRTILIKQKIEYAYTAGGVKTIVSGEKTTADGLPAGKFYDITPAEGYDRYVEMPFQQFRITAILDTAQLNAKIRPILALTGGLNSAAWSLLGGVGNIVKHQAMYRGCSWSLYRNSPGATRLYRADLDFLVHWKLWSRKLTRTEYNSIALQVPLYDTVGDEVGQTNKKGKLVIDNEAAEYFYRGEYNFATLLNPLLT